MTCLTFIKVKEPFQCKDSKRHPAQWIRLIQFLDWLGINFKTRY